MTYLQLINRVMRGLREKQVVGVTSATGFTELVGQYVNQAKHDIEDAGPWEALRTSVTGTLTVSQQTEDLTSSTNERSYIYVDPFSGVGQAWITTSGSKGTIAVIPQAAMRQMWQMTDNTVTGVPVYVSFSKSASGITAEFYPAPDAAYTYRFEFVVPQAELSAAGDTLSIPSEPVWRTALAMAVEERGDEFSGNVAQYYDRAEAALHSAIMSDFGRDPLTFRSE